MIDLVEKRLSAIACAGQLYRTLSHAGLKTGVELPHLVARVRDVPCITAKRNHDAGDHDNDDSCS
jgi:hypothetical protein